MLLTISTDHRPATDLGFLLMKHPDRVHARELAFGTATIFYPEAAAERCTAALTLDIDPVRLVRGGGARVGGLFDQYVTDRPYAVSSFLSVAISRLLGTAMGGRSRERQELADTPIPLTAMLTPLPCRGGPEILERLFTPLGYEVTTRRHALDPRHPDWGDSVYVTATLSGRVRLGDLLAHLFVLVPVLDNQKHYYVGTDEVGKLLAKGQGWLEDHPAKQLIARRYLKHRAGLTRAALEQLAEQVEPQTPELHEAQEAEEEALEVPMRLNDLRLEAVTEALLATGAARVLDLGCGEGKLLRRLLREKQFVRLVGVDTAPKVLERAAQRLKLEQMRPRQRERIELLQGSLVYRDERLNGFDAAAVIEVIEHMDVERLPAFERALFGEARPRSVVVTTPNREFNATFERLTSDRLRHPDHRFEWTRAEFAAWATAVADRYRYAAHFDGIGEPHPDHGAPTQMAVFSR